MEGRTRTRTLETFTINEAAEALGKSTANFRRWVEHELVPPPFLKSTDKNWYCYCRQELVILQGFLVEHEREFTYLCASHQVTLNRMHQAIHGFRDIEFGRGLYGRINPSA